MSHEVNIDPAVAARRVLVVVPAGDPARAGKLAQRTFPNASVDVIGQDELRSRGRRRVLSTLGSSQADVLVVFCVDADVPPDQPDHLLMAILAGASHLCRLEESGRSVFRPTGGASLGIVARLAVEPVVGGIAVALLTGGITLLNRRLERRGFATSSPFHLRAPTGARLRMVYLRSLPQPDSGVGGTASHAIGWVHAFGNLGHRVHAIVAPPYPAWDHHRVETTVIPYQRTWFFLKPFRAIETHLRFLVRAWRMVKAEPPDFYFARHRRLDASAAVLALLTRRPLLLAHEGSEELKPAPWQVISPLRLVRAYERLNHLVATGLMMVSAEAERDLIENRGVDPAKTEITPSGVDTTRFRPGVGGAARREELGVGPDDLVVGFCGTFAPWQGISMLIEAVTSLPARPHLHTVLVGDGPTRPAIEEQLARSSSENTVTITGLVPSEKVPSYLDACDILACPSQVMPEWEDFIGSPTKLFEYLAMGKAIVASDVGQVGDVIRDGENGLLVKEGDAAELASAISRLAGDRGLRERLGSQARRDAEASGGWEENARRALGCLVVALDGTADHAEPHAASEVEGTSPVTGRG